MGPSRRADFVGLLRFNGSSRHGEACNGNRTFLYGLSGPEGGEVTNWCRQLCARAGDDEVKRTANLKSVGSINGSCVQGQPARSCPRAGRDRNQMARSEM